MKATYRNTMVVFLSVFINVNTLANTPIDYNQAQAYIASRHFLEKMQSSVATAKHVLPPVTEHPKQATYYDHPAALASGAASQMATTNTVGNVVSHDALMRPKITVNTQSPGIAFSKNIQNNADAISDGTYKDCHKKVITDNSATQKTCSTGLPFTFPCTKTLNVRIETKTVTKQANVNLSNHFHVRSFSRASVTLPQETGLVTGLSMHVRDGNNPWSCFQSYGLKINGVTVGWYHGQCGHYLGDLQFDAHGVKIPFTNGSVTVTLIGGMLSGHVSGSLSFSYQAQQNVPIKTWVSTCASIPASCRVSKTQCLEPGSTKIINGVPVSASCWKTKDTQQCGAPMSSSCRSLANAGCTQIHSRCEKKDAGACERYTLTWSCPMKKTIGTGLQCGQRFYCMDGSCQSTSHETNKDFGQSVTELRAAAQAGEDVKKQGLSPNTNPNAIRLFSGHAAHCREVVLGALNCCADRGWAKGIFLNCNAEEKQLGHAKEQGGLVVYVGRYCSNSVLGVCTEHRRGYCIFPSRIAYDVQVGGRQAQLGRGFGDGKTPDCSGLSPQEIGKIHFDRIDFSNAVTGVVGKATLPGETSLQQRIEKALQNKIAGRSSND